MRIAALLIHPFNQPVPSMNSWWLAAPSPSLPSLLLGNSTPASAAGAADIGTPSTYTSLENYRQRGSNGLINESVGELWRNEKRQHMDPDIAVLTG